eukprot:3394667-Prymnesium_polylepis.4
MIQLNHPEPLSTQGRKVATSPRASQEAPNKPHGPPYSADDSGKESELHKRTGHGGWTGEAGPDLLLTL